MLEAALVAGYTSCGIDVELLGVVPTPAVAWVAAHRDCPGVMISASHNPYEDNGIKLFAPGGRKLLDHVEADIQDHLHAGLLGQGPALPEDAAIHPGVIVPGEAASGWFDSIQDSIGDRRFESLSVVLDCAHGSASTAGPDVFRSLGAKVTVIGAEPDGQNINAGVGSTHPAVLQAAVLAEGADVGLAFDGDADRLIAVDHTGEIVDGDHILAILARDWKSAGQLRHDTVVVTVMSNLGFRLAMRDAGISVVITDVGDRYVLEALNAGRDGKNFSLGGEQSGHVICRDIASTGDGILAGVQLLDTVKRAGRPLRDLATDAMRTYPQVLKNVRLPYQDPMIAERLADVVAEAEQELGDQGRVLVRPSGTEPLVRIMVEHLEAAVADRVCDRLVAVATERVSSAR